MGMTRVSCSETTMKCCKMKYLYALLQCEVKAEVFRACILILGVPRHRAVFRVYTGIPCLFTDN